MKMLYAVVGILGLLLAGRKEASAQDYVDSYVLNESDYRCISTNSQVKHFTKQGDLRTASLVAYEAGMCALDGRGEKTKKQDVGKAIEWFQKSAAFDPATPGSPLSAGYVGYRFLGMGYPSVPANREMADFWLHVAAKGYDATAEYNLGLAYLKGDVLPQDNKQAIEWLTAALQMRSSHAAVVLAGIYREGKIAPQNMELSNALTGMVPQYAAQEDAAIAQRRASSEELEASLNQIRADHQAAMANIWTQGISNIVTEATTPNPITVATNQQLSQINATAAQQQQQRQNAAAQEALNKMLAKQASTQGTQPSVALSKSAASPQPVIASVQVPTLAITPAVVSPATTASASGSGASGSGTSHNVTPISNSCITMDFDGEYHWDRYTSHCGVPVHVDLVFQRPLGVVSILHLEDGHPQGTAHSRADYEKYGNPRIYVCPDGSHMVDSTGNAYPQTAPAVYYCRLNGW